MGVTSNSCTEMILDNYLKILDTTMYIYLSMTPHVQTIRLHFARDGIADLTLDFNCKE